jgi:uncharacterized protein YdhG (YjbR/CyaY superfamily)
MKATQTRGATASRKKFKALSDVELTAMKETINERKVAASRGVDRAADEQDVLAKIAEMQKDDRAMAERIHAIVKASAPALSPRLWYGMPAYAKNGKVVCFFQSGRKYKTRYSTLGFQDPAGLDDGLMWPVAFALKELRAAEEAKIRALVKKAVS